LVIVVFVFMVCQTPTFIDRIVWAFVDKNQRAQCGHWHYYYTAVGDVMVILNSSVNFIVYVLASRKFRHDLFAIVRQGRCSCVGRPVGPEAEAEASRGQCAPGHSVSVADRISLFSLEARGGTVPAIDDVVNEV